MMDERARLAAFVDARLTEAERHTHRIMRWRATRSRRVLDAWRGDRHGDPLIEGRLCAIASRFVTHPDFRDEWQINEPW